MIDAKSILKQNTQKHKKIDIPYNPITGEGCVGERVRLVVTDAPCFLASDNIDTESLLKAAQTRLTDVQQLAGETEIKLQSARIRTELKETCLRVPFYLVKRFHITAFAYVTFKFNVNDRQTVY